MINHNNEIIHTEITTIKHHHKRYSINKFMMMLYSLFYSGNFCMNYFVVVVDHFT
jgi:hypothetical protein